MIVVKFPDSILQFDKKSKMPTTNDTSVRLIDWPLWSKLVDINIVLFAPNAQGNLYITGCNTLLYLYL